MRYIEGNDDSGMGPVEGDGHFGEAGAVTQVNEDDVARSSKDRPCVFVDETFRGLPDVPMGQGVRQVAAFRH